MKQTWLQKAAWVTVIIAGFYVIGGGAQAANPNGSTSGFNNGFSVPCDAPAVNHTALCWSVPSTDNPTGLWVSASGPSAVVPYAKFSTFLPQGQALTLAIGTVTTTAPGTQASATITGIAPNFILNISIPQGATGAQGQQGATGAQGPPGSGSVTPKCAGLTATNFAVSGGTMTGSPTFSGCQ